MRPLAHPSIDELTLAGLLHALSDPVRLDIVLCLSAASCEMNCISSAKELQGLSKSTLSHHFRILREAGLVRSERRGVELLNRLRLDEIERRFPGVVGAILAVRRAECRAEPRRDAVA
ncbi:ArsR/SmtB family transcription factor [Prosthecomicrobium sp. N25]|uniref:ArsR/SmtB family transcription factor n=1 Tax=Prosthecomicrobium sp. N25 TaxID=3129254 RepID=UPI003077C08F